MKTLPKILKTTTYILFYFLICTGKVAAQQSISSLPGKYTNDSTGKFHESKLILESDGTYTIYGLCIDRAHDDFYVWYSKGTYTTEGNVVYCTFNEQMTSDPKFLQQIKNSYLHRSDHALIVNYFEFVKEEYVSYKFTNKAPGYLYDEKNEIMYKKK